MSELAQEGESKLTEDMLFNAREVSTSSLLICNINLCLLTLDRIVPTLVHSSELLIARLKSLQNESTVTPSHGTVAERITSSISRLAQFLCNFLTLVKSVFLNLEFSFRASFLVEISPHNVWGLHTRKPLNIFLLKTNITINILKVRLQKSPNPIKSSENYNFSFQ